VGADEVEIGDNRFSHRQYGGSALRWDSTQEIQLSPQKSLRIESCGFRTTEPEAAFTTIDVATLTVRSLATNAGKEPAGDDVEIGCEPLIAGAPGSLMGQAVPLPVLNNENPQPETAFPQGVALGSCAAAITTDGKTGGGYLVYGALDPARVAELRFVALDLHALVLQVHEPRPDPGPAANWVGTDHLELWTTHDELAEPGQVDPAKLVQLGVTLDGKLHAGIGKAKPPAVQRWDSRDERNRPVTVLELTWSDTDALTGGVMLAYSQAQAGRQARLFATAPLAKNRPSYLPPITQIPVGCAAVGERWDVTANPGNLEGP